MKSPGYLHNDIMYALVGIVYRYVMQYCHKLVDELSLRLFVICIINLLIE